MSRALLLWVLACGRLGPPANPSEPVLVAAPAQDAEPLAAAGRCLTEEALGAPVDHSDLDGDGTADRIVEDARSLVFYVRRGACFEPRASLPLEGPLAFVFVSESGAGMRTISVETWLMHGDRRAESYRWSGTRYESTGRSEEIPGPRR